MDLFAGDLKAGALDEALTKPPVVLHLTNRCGIAPELKWKLRESKAECADHSGPMSKKPFPTPTHVKSCLEGRELQDSD